MAVSVLFVLVSVLGCHPPAFGCCVAVHDAPPALQPETEEIQDSPSGLNSDPGRDTQARHEPVPGDWEDEDEVTE